MKKEWERPELVALDLLQTSSGSMKWTSEEHKRINPDAPEEAPEFGSMQD